MRETAAVASKQQKRYADFTCISSLLLSFLKLYSCFIIHFYKHKKNHSLFTIFIGHRVVLGDYRKS